MGRAGRLDPDSPEVPAEKKDGPVEEPGRRHFV
jgi:hypothetical protein